MNPTYIKTPSECATVATKSESMEEAKVYPTPVKATPSVEHVESSADTVKEDALVKTSGTPDNRVMRVLVEPGTDLAIQSREMGMLPTFANDMSTFIGSKRKGGMNTIRLLRELESWMVLWKLTGNLERLKQFDAYYDLLEIVQKIQHVFLIGKPALTQQQFDELLEFPKETLLTEEQKLRRDARLEQRLNDFSFDTNLPTVLPNIQNAFNLLELRKVRDPHDLMRWKVKVMRKWIAGVTGCVEKAEIITRLEETRVAVMAGSFDKMPAWEFDRYLLENLVRYKPLLYHYSFIYPGWPGFYGFEGAVQRFVKRYFNKSIDDEDFDPALNYDIIDIIRAWIPNVIWNAACQKRNPATLREVVDSIKGLSSYSRFSAENLWKYFGVRTGNLTGPHVYDPDLWQFMDERFQNAPLNNLLSAIKSDFLTQVPKGQGPIDLYPVTWKPSRPQKRALAEGTQKKKSFKKGKRFTPVGKSAKQ